MCNKKILDLNNKINELKNSPIFAITLGSKELCHSNFWAWLIRSNHEYAKVFFDEIDIAEINSCTREEKNIDLTITTNEKKKYIIENKLKSLPNVEQIKEYQQKLNPTGGLLTGFIEPNFMDDQSLINKWKFKDYGDLADDIQKILSADLILQDNNKKIVQSYIDSIRLTNDIITQKLKLVGNSLDYKEFNDLSEIRYDDVAKKLQANEFLKYMRDKQINTPEDWELEAYTGFTNKNAFYEIRYIKKNGKNKGLTMGIQIQANKYERTTQRSPNKTTADKLHDQMSRCGWLDKTKGSTIFNHPTSMKKDYCKYITKEYCQIYQYDVINDYKFDKLADRIKRDMDKAFEIIKTYNL